MECPSAVASQEHGPMATHSTATPSRCSETSLGATIHSKVFIVCRHFKICVTGNRQ